MVWGTHQELGSWDRRGVSDIGKSHSFGRGKKIDEKILAKKNSKNLQKVKKCTFEN